MAQCVIYCGDSGSMTSATGQTTMKLDQVMAEWQNASLEIEELLRQSKQIETAVPAPEETPASAITPPGTSCEQDPVSEPRLTLSSPSERRTPELITRVLRECRVSCSACPRVIAVRVCRSNQSLRIHSWRLLRESCTRNSAR